MSDMSAAARGEGSSGGGQIGRVVTPRNLQIYKPTIAAINGYALAGGFWMAMDCHLAVAAEEAAAASALGEWLREHYLGRKTNAT